MAGIHFDITADNTHFINSLNQTRNALRTTIKDIESQGITTEQYFKNIKQAAGALAAGFSAKAFVNQIVQVRGEFQQLEVAFKTMLGSEEKAATLMEQLTKTAAVTPFDLQGVTNGAKQLLAYGIEAEKVNETLIHLGDIAAGLSLPLNDLVYLYGTTMTQGRMFTQDLRQFQGRGIPIAEELAKQFGVTKDKVGELVTAGKVGAKEFNQAIMAMSSEGGKFAGLMEAQSKTITGQISNIGDAIDSMFNNMGKQSEGIINGTLSVVSSLVENYQKVGEVIGGVVATYGTYKAAVMTVTALQGLQAAGIGALTTAETIHYGWLVLCEKAQKLLNATMLANPYVLAATAVAGLVAVMVTMKSEQERVNEAYDEYNQKKADIIRKEEEHKARIEELARVAGNESLSTDTRRMALVELEQKYPAIFAKYDTEAEKLKHIRDLKAEIAALDGKGSITKASNELNSVEKRIKELEGIHTDSFINSAGGRTYTGRNRNDKEEAELKALQRRRSELTNQIRKDEGNAYLTNLTGVSNEDLKKQIEERRNLLARMDVSDKKYGRTRQGGATGVYTRDELQGQLQILQSEQARRKKVLEDSSKDFVAEANKAYKKEQDALRKLESLTDPKKRSASKQEIDGKKVSEMSGDEFLAAVEKQQKAVAEAKKKVDTYKVKGDEKAGADAAAIRQKQFDLEQKDAERQAAQKRALDEALEDAELAGIVNDSEREIRERDIQHKRKLQQIRNQADEWKKEAYKAAEERFNATNTNKGRTFADTEEGKAGWQGQKLSEEQTATIEAQVKEENAIHERAVREQYRNEAQAMHDYLKEYGTIQQQKYAIAKEYDDKIAKESDENRKRILQAEKSSALAKLDAQNIAANIDWSQTFSGVGNVLQGLAKETLAKIDEYMSSAEFKSLEARDKQPYRELRQQLVEAGGVTASNPFSGKVWDEIGNAAQKYRDSVQSLNDANAHAEDVRKRLTEAEEDAAKNPADLGKKELADNLRTAFDEASEVVKEAENNVSEAQTDLRDKTEAVAKGFQNFDTILGQITSGSLSGFALAVGNVIKKISGSKDEVAKDFGALFGEVGKNIGGLIGAILQVIDILGTEPAKFIDDLLKKIADVLEAVLSQLPEIIGSAIKGVGGIIGGMFSGIGNLFAGIFGLGADNSPYEEAIEKWGWLLDSWKENLEYEKKLMEKAYGGDLLKQQGKTLASLIETQKAVAEVYRGWAGSGAGLFSHSNGYNVNDDVRWDYLRQYSQRNGNNWASIVDEDVSNLFKLSWEDLEKLKHENSQFWSSIHSDAQKYLDDYIEAGRAMVEITEQVQEQITGVSFDSVFDGFMSALYELAEGSEDVFDEVAQNWERMMNQMVLNNLVGGKYKEKLKKWYEQWEKAYSGDQNITSAEIASLRTDYNNLIKEAANEVEALKTNGLLSALDTTSTQDQSAMYRSAAQITYEQADHLEGILTALQIAQYQGLNNITNAVNLAAQNILSMQSVASEMRNLMLTSQDYLLNITRTQKTLNDTVLNMQSDLYNASRALENL